MSWRNPASLKASVLHLYKEGVGLVSRGKSFKTDFPGSHSLRGGDNWTRDDQSVAPTKRVLSVCRCWVQHSCSNGSFRKAEWPRLGPRVNCEPTPPGRLWATRQRETSLSVSHCPGCGTSWCRLRWAEGSQFPRPGDLSHSMGCLWCGAQRLDTA